MGLTTKIEWCDSTLNLQMGCDGCELWNPKVGVKRCYAGKITERMTGEIYTTSRSGVGWPVSFGQPKIFPERLKEALRWPDLTGKDRPNKPWLNGYPRLIFLNDMGDTFTESLPLDWFDDFIPPMESSRHIWIVLTKRPRRMFEFWESYLAPIRGSGEDENIPDNFWLLTSVTSPENVGRIRGLLKLESLGARVLGVSYEPAWGRVDFAPFLYEGPDRLKWVITGGESGAGAKPSHPDWFREVRDDCQAAGVAFFFKQWGEWRPPIHGERFNTIHGRAGNPPSFLVDRTGNIHCTYDAAGDGAEPMIAVGKKAAGALLDDREWRQMPEGWRVMHDARIVR